MRFGIPVLGLCAVMLGAYGTRLPVPQQESAKKITEAEIKSFINSGLGEDKCESLDQIFIEHIEYHDFFQDGQQEAVVVAATCMTGTAGPDVHAVYRRGVDGKIVELPIQHVGGKLPVFGNSNFELAVEDGQLVAHWVDSSDREAPLVVWFKQDGDKFVEDHRDVKGPFQTSYDCAKATEELDRAICYSPSVAALDLRLGQAYLDALQQLPTDKRQQFRGEQREWLATREKECTLYKWWVDCLADLYTKRIAELKQQ